MSLLQVQPIIPVGSSLAYMTAVALEKFQQPMSCIFSPMWLAVAAQWRYDRGKGMSHAASVA
jgi:hypothetical protein